MKKGIIVIIMLMILTQAYTQNIFLSGDNSYNIGIHNINTHITYNAVIGSKVNNLYLSTGIAYIKLTAIPYTNTVAAIINFDYVNRIVIGTELGISTKLFYARTLVGYNVTNKLTYTSVIIGATYTMLPYIKYSVYNKFNATFGLGIKFIWEINNHRNLIGYVNTY